MEEIKLTLGMSTQINSQPVMEGSFTPVAGAEGSQEVKESNSNFDKSAVVIEEVDYDLENADELLDAAKEEGIEEALQKLAGKDFNNNKNLLRKNQNEPYEFTLEDLKEEEISKKQENAEPDPEIEAVKAHNMEMASQIKNLTERNSELANRVVQLEGNLEVSLQTLLQMSRVLQEMLAKKEDEEEKEGLLELALDIFQYFVKSIVLDDEELKRQEAQKSEKPAAAGKTGSKKSDQETIALFMQKMLEKQKEASSLPKQEEAKAA